MGRLLLVYNADSGLFATVTDAAHKILSPDTYRCDLCKLTHGWVSERSRWRSFIASLPLDCVLLHRDQFRRAYPGICAPLPAVFRLVDGRPEVCVDAGTLAGCADLDALISAVRESCCSGERR